jgi:hypothetical protein
MAKKSQSKEQVKRSLKKLREAGLYAPKHPRRAPTDYAKSLLKRFSDVLTGKARAVTVKQKGRAGHKLARSFVSGGGPGTVRAVRNKVIVPVQAGERLSFAPKAKRIRVTRKVGRQRYVREPLQGKHRTVESIRAQLRLGDSIAVPFYRGSRGTEYIMMKPDEFSAFIDQVNQSAARDHKAPYQVASYAEAFRLEGVEHEHAGFRITRRKDGWYVVGEDEEQGPFKTKALALEWLEESFEGEDDA